MRSARRILAFVALSGSLAGLYLILEPVLPSGGAVVEQQAVAAPARPADVPRRIPAWAWELHEWESTLPAVRPPRPAGAPKQVPDWYAEWRAWRLQISR